MRHRCRVGNRTIRICFLILRSRNRSLSRLRVQLYGQDKQRKLVDSLPISNAFDVTQVKTMCAWWRFVDQICLLFALGTRAVDASESRGASLVDTILLSFPFDESPQNIFVF